MAHILIFVLLHNERTFYLCITDNDAKKVATLGILSEKLIIKKGKRKVQGVPQSQAATLP